MEPRAFCELSFGAVHFIKILPICSEGHELLHLLTVSEYGSNLVWISLRVDSDKDIHRFAPFCFCQVLSLLWSQIERGLMCGGIVERKRVAVCLVWVQEISQVNIAVGPDFFLHGLLDCKANGSACYLRCLPVGVTTVYNGQRNGITICC